jgi:hypothetical protein
VLAGVLRALTTHAKVKKAFENWQQGAILINDVRSGFTFGGITFEEYRGQATDRHDGTVNERRFIAAGEVHAFPLGTVDTFGTYLAPADFNETVNTARPAALRQAGPRKFERGTDLHTQSNPLPMCHRPGVLVKLTKSKGSGPRCTGRPRWPSAANFARRSRCFPSRSPSPSAPTTASHAN